jgi:hypothetical protein
MSYYKMNGSENIFMEFYMIMDFCFDIIKEQMKIY